MKLIIGLGNPGRKYEGTRHNAGVMLFDFLNKHWDRADIKLLASDEFMNNSGRFVKRAKDYYKIDLDDLYIAHDDLDLRVGEYKIQKGVGPKDHKGILSLEDEVNSTEFWRIRIGVDNRDPDNRISGDDYVLQKFSEEESELVQSTFGNIKQELLEL